MRRLVGLGLALAALLTASLARTQSATGDLVAHDSLRVCADPRDLPFSDEQGNGFENKIAELLGGDLSVPVTYVWYPHVTGFLKNTLLAGRCDLVMGTVAGDSEMETTSPYYYTGYVMVFRRDGDWRFTDWNDPALKQLRFGVVARTPPADLLLSHGLMDRVKPYPLVVDTRVDAPSQRMLHDVVDKTIDVGLLWGPLAGYYIRHENLPLTLSLLKGEPSLPRLDYHISMGLRRNEGDWRRKLNGLIRARQEDINKILIDYGVPLFDEQGAPI